MDLVALLQSLGGPDGAITAWQAVPKGVRSRIAQGYDRLTGRLTRPWDISDEKENAGLADEARRANNQAEAQKAVLQLLVPEIAKQISGDQDLLERAMIETMGEAYRKQQNKDAVAEECVKDLAQKTQDHSITDEPLAEDWLNTFSSYAERASSEHARHLFGRILSGQVRRPGSFSLSTIRCLSEIDQKIAKLFTDISPLISIAAILISTEDKNKQFSDFLALQEAGLVTGVESNLSIKIPISNGNTGEWRDERFYVRIKTSSESPVHIPCIALTKAGRELLTLLDRAGTHGDRLNMMYNAIPRFGIQSFSIHLILEKANNRVNFLDKPLKEWPEQSAVEPEKPDTS